jgi:hypothetical protein
MRFLFACTILFLAARLVPAQTAGPGPSSREIRFWWAGIGLAMRTDVHGA